MALSICILAGCLLAGCGAEYQLHTADREANRILKPGLKDYHSQREAATADAWQQLQQQSKAAATPALPPVTEDTSQAVDPNAP